MLQSITTARIESVSEGPNQTASVGNRGDTAFSALMDKQQSATEVPAAVNPLSGKGKRQASSETDTPSSQAASALGESSSGQDESVGQSQGTASAEPKNNKSASAQKRNEDVDFLQHLQASLATPTELTLPTPSGEEGEDKSSADAVADGKADKLKKSEKSGGKLLPPGHELQAAMLQPIGAGSGVSELDSAEGDDSLDIAAEEIAKQAGGKSLPSTGTEAKPGSDAQDESSAVAVKAEGEVSVSVQSRHLAHQGVHGREAREQSASQLGGLANSGTSEAIQSKEQQGEPVPVSSNTDKSVADNSLSAKGREEATQTAGRTQSETKTAEPSPLLPDAQSRGEFRHSVGRVDDGVAPSVLVDDSALTTSAQGGAGESAATEKHQVKAQLAKEMALKEMASDASSDSDPHLLPQEETHVAVGEARSHLHSSGRDELISSSAMQADNQSSEVRPLSTPTHSSQLSSVPQTTAERGTELYRELASVNVSSHSKAAPELAERLTLMIGQKWQEAELELEPQGMGKMTIQLSIGQDQQASVQFIVQQHHSREVVEQTLPKLKEMLAQQGIQLDQASVQQQASGQGQSGQSGQWSARAGGDGAHGQGQSRNQGGGAQSQPGESVGQNVSVRSRQAAGIDFYA